MHKLTKKKYQESRYAKGDQKSPQSQKNHSTVRSEDEQVEVMVLSVNYQNLERNQPAMRNKYTEKVLNIDVKVNQKSQKLNGKEQQ